ncbi:MAG: hypothetical protein HY996_01315 [Micrococcales bacterium]|nr:hypothetical protein [Micrococcales bacterium]
MTPIAARFALQQSWWIASEIARRHGNLEISRVGDDRFGGILLVHAGPEGPRVQFHLATGVQWTTREGRLESLGWDEVIGSDDPHVVVRRLERAAGFGRPTSPAPTNPRTIVYRIAAALLASKIDDRHAWQVVPAPLLDEHPEETHAALAAFPSTGRQIEHAWRDIAELREHAQATGRTAYWHETFWFVLRDVEPVMVLDEAGYAHLPDGVRINLLDLYRSQGRDIARVVGVLLMNPDAALAIAQRGNRQGGNAEDGFVSLAEFERAVMGGTDADQHSTPEPEPTPEPERSPGPDSRAPMRFPARLIEERSWWLASQLTRHDPELRVHQMHPGGGMYDVLRIYRSPRDETSGMPSDVIDLNRNGGIHIHDTPENRRISWEEVILVKDPAEAVNELERLRGWSPTDAVESPASLVYRVCARILLRTLADDRPWDITMGYLDADDADAGYHFDVSRFPSAAAATSHLRESDWLAWSRWWVARLNGSPVLVMHDAGTAHNRDGDSMDLLRLRDDIDGLTSAVFRFAV